MPNESDLNAGSPVVPHPSVDVARGPGYEVRDTNIKGILAFIVGLFTVLIVTQFGLWGLLNAIVGPRTTAPPPTASPYTEEQQPAAGGLPPGGKVTPEATLEITDQRRKLTAREEATLGGYGRAADNTKGGAVRIPIDRAIDLIAERGLPASGGAARTEVDVNSHSGEAAPAGRGKSDKSGGESQGASGKGPKN